MPQQWSVLNEPSGPYSSALSSLVNCTPDDDRRCWSSPPGNRLSSQYAAEPGRTAAAASSSSSSGSGDDGDSRRTDIAAAEGTTKTGYDRLKGRLVHTIDDDSREHVPRTTTTTHADTTTDDERCRHTDPRRRRLSVTGQRDRRRPRPATPVSGRSTTVVDGKRRWRPRGVPSPAAAKALVYGVLPPRKSAPAGGEVFSTPSEETTCCPPRSQTKTPFSPPLNFSPPPPPPMHSATVFGHVHVRVPSRRHSGRI